MGSKAFTKVVIPLVALGLAAAPAGAAAGWRVDTAKSSSAREYQASTPAKDYSKNGATGDFSPAVNIPSEAAVTTAVSHSSDDSFAWGAAALGAGLTLLGVFLISATTKRVRRTSPSRPSAA